MATRTRSSQPVEGRRPLRTVAVVSRRPHAAALDAMPDAGNYDVVFIESVGHAYSQIRRAAPDVVILCLDIDDVDGFQVLSMLMMDDATSRIPIITYVGVVDSVGSDEHWVEIDRQPAAPPIILSRN